MTRASVLIPIHDKPTTLPLAVDTVLRQGVSDLEVILIGDGVTDDVRDVVADLLGRDDRVRFLDFPKGPHHGERYRHEAIEAAGSDAIFYLCDDDLLLPDHVGDLLALLEDHDLVQCLNGWVLPDGEVRLYPGDLADPACVELHLRDDIRFNIVSITGTAHTRRAYQRAADRWDTTPQGWWPDHWQFRKLMRLPGFRGATSGRMTALQFPTSSEGRDTWSDDERAAEIVPWHRLVTSYDAQADVDRRVTAGLLPQLRAKQVESMGVAVALAERGAYVDAIEAARADADLHAAQLGELVEVLRGHVDALVETREALLGQVASLDQRLGNEQAEVENLRRRIAREQARVAALRQRIEHKKDVIARLRASRR